MKPKTKSRFPSQILMLGASLLFTATLHADNGTWTANASGNWSDSGNWDGGTIADGADFTATLADVTANVTITNDGRTIGNITAADTNNDYTISDSTLTLDTTSGRPTIDIPTSSRRLYINSVIAGTDGFEKSGPGMLRFGAAANTFTGGLVLNGGQIGENGGGKVVTTAHLNNNLITVESDSRITFAGGFTSTNGITLNNGSVFTLGANNSDVYFQDAVTGDGGFKLVKEGDGRNGTHLQSTGNTFTGGVEFAGARRTELKLNSFVDSGSLGAGNIRFTEARNAYEHLFILDPGFNAALTLNNRQFDIADSGADSSSEAVGILNNSAQALTINSDLIVSGANDKRFKLGGTGAGTNTFAGIIPDGSGVLSLIKADSGAWIISGNNTYTGDTTIEDGTLEIQGSGTYTNINNTDLSPSPLIVNTAGTPSISGTVSGSMELIKDGAGTLTITGAATQSGGTTVDNGTLSLGDGTDNASLSAFGPVSVATGAVLDLNYSSGNVNNVFSLELGGVVQPPGQYGHSSSGADNGGQGSGLYNAFFADNTGIINSLGGDLTPLGIAYWDGPNTGGTGDNSSDGGIGTWDDTTDNWDYGTVARAAWLNTTAAKAIFGGSAGTVSLGADLNIGELEINNVQTYTIGDAAEDNTLTFGGVATISINGNASVGDAVFRAGIAGSPTVNVTGRANNAAYFALEPPAAVTQTLGTLNMFNTNASNKVLRLGGGSTGNVVDQITWTVTGNQLQVRKQDTTNGGVDGSSWMVNQDISLNSGKIYVDEGTLILGGTDNFCSHSIEVGSGGRITLQGNWRIHDENEDFRVLSGGIVAPGGSVGTATFNWNSSRGNPSVGLVDLRDGSTYEWEVGAGVNNTDVIALTEPVVGGEAELVVASGTTLKVVDSGGSPSLADKLTVFTYESGVVAPDAATLQSNMTIDLTGTTWTAGPGGAQWGVDIDGGTGDGTIYVTNISAGGGGGTAFDTWAANGTLPGTVTFDGDLNGDGVKDGLAFLLGAANPDDDATSLLPVVSESGGGLVLTFSCLNDANNGTATLNVEQSSDLGITDAWAAAEVPEVSGGPVSGVTFVVTGGDPLNSVEATIDAGEAAAGKLFGRLQANQP